MSKHITSDELFKEINQSICNLNKCCVFKITGLSGSGEQHIINKIKKSYNKDVFILTPEFNIECLWAGGYDSSPFLFDKQLVEKITNNRIVICEAWYSTDIKLLNRLHEIIVYCSKTNNKKIFILNCTIPLTNHYNQQFHDLHLILEKEILGFSFILQPLQDYNLKAILDEDGVFEGLNDETKRTIVAWANGNEIILREIISSLKSYSKSDQKTLSLIVNNNDTIPLKLIYDKLYGIVIESLTERLSKVLNMAIVSGIDVYSEIFKEVDKSYIDILIQIEKETNIIKSENFQKTHYRFASQSLYDVLKDKLDKNIIVEYSLTLVDAIIRILKQNISAIPRIILLEKINEYLHFSINEYNKHYYAEQLIIEYFQNQMYEKCLHTIRQKYRMPYNKLKCQYPEISNFYILCHYELENYQECINILENQRKLSEDECLIYLKSYYQIGNPKKVINITATLNRTKWNNNQKLQLYSLLAGCYEWLDNNKQLVKYFQKSFKLASQNKDEQYFQLLRKSNIIIDSTLPEYEKYMMAAIEYFKNKNDFKSCAWCLHNWGTEKILKLKEPDSGLKKLNQAIDYLSYQLSTSVFDVKNSKAIYYMLNSNWNEAISILNDIQSSSKIEFCNIAYSLNLFHCLRKLNRKECCNNLLIEISKSFPKSIKNSSLKLQWQNFCVSKALFHLDNKEEIEALNEFNKAIRCMSKEYRSYYSYIAAKNIIELNTKYYTVDKKTLAIADYYSKSVEPICLKLYNEKITIAEIMFWE